MWCKFDADSITTIGIDHKVKFISRQEKRIQLQIWDTAGQERFRSLSKTLFKGSDGILLMYDISNYDSFKHIKNWIQDIKNNLGVPIEKIALIIVGNKSDLVEQRKVTFEEAKQYADEHELPYIETSAKEGININELFDSSIKSFLTNTKSFGGGKNIKLNSQSTNSSERGLCC